jgi:hypothetical protein
VWVVVAGRLAGVRAGRATCLARATICLDSASRRGVGGCVDRRGACSDLGNAFVKAFDSLGECLLHLDNFMFIEAICPL